MSRDTKFGLAFLAFKLLALAVWFWFVIHDSPPV